MHLGKMLQPKQTGDSRWIIHRRTYYRFYVKLSEMRWENGSTDFGVLYVPAVKPEYISNMPLWDGSIN